MTQRQFEDIVDLLKQILEAVKPKVQDPFRIAPDGPPGEDCNHFGTVDHTTMRCYMCGEVVDDS